MKGLAEVALIHGHEAARTIQELAKEDPEFAKRLIAAALDPGFILEKRKCVISERLAGMYQLSEAQQRRARRHWGV